MSTAASFNGQWTPAGGDLTSDASVAAATGAPTLHLFAKVPGTGAQALRFSRYDGVNWKNSEPLAGVTTDSAPAALTCNQRMYVFAKTGVGTQAVKWTWKDVSTSDTTTFAAWATLPSATTNVPVGLACRDAKLYVFLKGADNLAIYFIPLTTQTNTWGSWNEVPGGGRTYQALSAAVNMNNLELDVMAVGTNGMPYVNRLCYGCGDLAWTGWAPHPGWISTSVPVSAAWDPVTSPTVGVQMFFTNGAGAHVDGDAFDGASWRGSAMVRGHQQSKYAPTAVAFGYDLLLFAVGGVNAVDQNGPVDLRVWMTNGQPPGRLLSSYAKTASQISSYSSETPASKALDGRTDSLTNTLYDGHIDGAYAKRTISHTGQANFPWWQVDLGSQRTIKQVNVFNRLDSCCMSRLRDWSILISNDGLTWTEIFRDARPEGAGALTTFNENLPPFSGSNVGRTTTSSNWSARHVRVRINRNAEWLALAEVQVWGY
jgi:hypothetical protein